MNLFKKVLVILLTVLMLCSCGSKQEPKEEVVKDAHYYLQALIDFKSQDKNKNNTNDNAEFDKFLDECFISYLERDYIEMRTYVLDYHNYDVTKPEVSWGNLIYQDTSKADYYIERLNKLQTYDFDKLSYVQQYEYEKYEYYLLEQICLVNYQEYESLFSIYSDVLDNVAFNLDELKFNDKEYIDDYLVMAKDAGRFYEDALSFTIKQAENGLYLDNASIEYSSDYALQLLGDEENENYFISGFNKKIDQVDYLSKEEIEEYKKQNKEIVETYINPVLTKINETLLTYIDSQTKGNGGLCNYSEDYARFRFIYNASCNEDVDVIFNEIVDDFKYISDKYKEAIADDDTKDEYYMIANNMSNDIFGSSDITIINFLEDNLDKLVPAIDDMVYTVEQDNNVAEGSAVIAYHIKPTIDNPDGTVIRTNPNNMGEDVLDDFLIIAHEGIPGHMYQNQYYLRTSPSNVNTTYRFIGYKEGWATYNMFTALDLTAIENEGVKDISVFSWMMTYYLISLGDIYCNYYGLTVEEFADFLDENGYNKDYAEIVYDIALKKSGVNEQYGVGYLKMKQLNEKAKEELGDKFDQIDFNKELLVHGPIPFVILEKAVDDYILENK